MPPVGCVCSRRADDTPIVGRAEIGDNVRARTRVHLSNQGTHAHCYGVGSANIGSAGIGSVKSCVPCNLRSLCNVRLFPEQSVRQCRLQV